MRTRMRIPQPLLLFLVAATASAAAGAAAAATERPEGERSAQATDAAASLLPNAAAAAAAAAGGRLLRGTVKALLSEAPIAQDTASAAGLRGASGACCGDAPEVPLVGAWDGERRQGGGGGGRDLGARERVLQRRPCNSRARDRRAAKRPPPPPPRPLRLPPRLRLGSHTRRSPLPPLCVCCGVARRWQSLPGWGRAHTVASAFPAKQWGAAVHACLSESASYRLSLGGKDFAYRPSMQPPRTCLTQRLVWMMCRFALRGGRPARWRAGRQRDI
eukprot:365493-Chlamydomonas_euryale.AAC.7